MLRPQEFLVKALAKLDKLTDSDREKLLKAAEQPGRVEALEAAIRDAVKDA
jgi:hypothetical protein